MQMSHWRHMMVDGAEFWITCKWLKLLRKAGCLQLIQNSAPSTIGWRQCDIWMKRNNLVNKTQAIIISCWIIDRLERLNLFAATVNLIIEKKLHACWKIKMDVTLLNFQIEKIWLRFWIPWKKLVFLELSHLPFYLKLTNANFWQLDLQLTNPTLEMILV